MMTASTYRTLRVIDGGLATELGVRGFDLSDDLWSARALIDAPDAIADVHVAYFEAGADVAITASYQASYEGFAARGLSAADTTRLLQRSVALATESRARFRRAHPDARASLLVAASVGPYGATRYDGSEYHGNYGLSEDELFAFHGPRFGVLVESAPDLLACETIPSLLEARALLRLLRAYPKALAWISFTCRDGQHTSAGDELAECAQLLDGEPQVVAMGANCVAPEHVESIVRTFASVTGKPIVVYPNSGETWNAVTRSWEGGAPGSAAPFTTRVAAWLDAGASWIGGCCRTSPRDTRVVRSIVDDFSAGRQRNRAT